MKLHNYECRIHEYLGSLFMVWSPEELPPAVGELVRFEGKWYAVTFIMIDEGVDYALVRPATLWERFFGVKPTKQELHS